LSVLISTAALSYQQSKARKAALAQSSANEDHPETHQTIDGTQQC